MGTCTSSHNCSGCEGCNYCNGCVTCEGAENTCSDDICNTCNSICQSTGQRVGDFSFNECVSSGQIFITADAWKNLISYIQNAYAAGTVVDGGDPNLSNDNKNVKSGDPMKAEMYRNIAAALNGLGKSTDNSSISTDGIDSGKVIYGSYFDNIETYSKKWQFENTQCDNNCNVSCNATCNRCNNCNNCNATCEEECNNCNSCEGCKGNCETTCESVCQTGCEVSCQTGCEVSCQSDNPEG